MKTVLIAIAVVGLICAGCVEQPNFQGDDLLMVQGAAVIKDAINNYRNQYAEFPEDMDFAKQFVATGDVWPTNPYNGQVVVDTKSPDFELATSVGNVYYQKFIRNEVQVGFQLHVFGDDGKLHIFGNSAFGIKE